jgi:hypothetical protein
MRQNHELRHFAGNPNCFRPSAAFKSPENKKDVQHQLRGSKIQLDTKLGILQINIKLQEANLQTLRAKIWCVVRDEE